MRIIRTSVLKGIIFQLIWTVFTRYVQTLHWNNRMFICLWPFYTYILAIRNADRSLRRFSVFESFSIKDFTRSDGINQLWSSKYYVLWVCVCILALVIRHRNLILSAPHYMPICGLSGCTLFFYIISQRHDIRTKVIENKIWDRFSLQILSEIFHILRRIEISYMYIGLQVKCSLLLLDFNQS
jgi:hypothetical protein